MADGGKDDFFGTLRGRKTCWCVLPRYVGMARYSMVSYRTERAAAPSQHRQGNSGKEMGQGQSLATTLNPLVQRQGACRATSDGKPGQIHPRSGQDHVEHSPQEDQRRLLAQAKGISSPTASAHPYP